jgi:hypothetical protein
LQTTVCVILTFEVIAASAESSVKHSGQASSGCARIGAQK